MPDGNCCLEPTCSWGKIIFNSICHSFWSVLREEFPILKMFQVNKAFQLDSNRSNWVFKVNGKQPWRLFTQKSTVSLEYLVVSLHQLTAISQHVVVAYKTEREYG